MLNRPTKRTVPKTRRPIPAPGTTRFVVTQSRAGHYSLTLKVVEQSSVDPTWKAWRTVGHRNMISAPPPQWMKDEMMAEFKSGEQR